MIFLTKSILTSVIKMKKKFNLINKENRRIFNFAFSVIFQNIWFLLLTLPLCCTTPILSLKKIDLIQYTSESEALVDLLIAIFNMLLYFYFTTKFLNHIIFNSVYRQICLDVFFSKLWTTRSVPFVRKQKCEQTKL